MLRPVLIGLILCAACVTIKNPEVIGGQKSYMPKDGRLVVLADADSALYGQVITGIHVASSGNYQVWPFYYEGFDESAFLNRLMALKPKGLIALGPRSAQAVAASRIILPSVFSMVPRIDNYEFAQVFTAGVRMTPDVLVQLSLVRKLMPHIKGLGVVFSRHNSRNIMERVRSLCDDEQFDLVNIEVQNSSDVLPVLERYTEEVQAILMLDDPVLLDLQVLRQMSLFLSSKKIAFFALDCSMVEAGAMASFGTNFFLLGQDLVNIVGNEHAASLYQPTQFIDAKQSDICLNMAVAKKISDDQQIILRAAEFAADTRANLKVYQ